MLNDEKYETTQIRITASEKKNHYADVNILQKHKNVARVLITDANITWYQNPLYAPVLRITAIIVAMLAIAAASVGTSPTHPLATVLTIGAVTVIGCGMFIRIVLVMPVPIVLQIDGKYNAQEALAAIQQLCGNGELPTTMTQHLRVKEFLHNVSRGENGFAGFVPTSERVVLDEYSQRYRTDKSGPCPTSLSRLKTMPLEERCGLMDTYRAALLKSNTVMEN